MDRLAQAGVRHGNDNYIQGSVRTNICGQTLSFYTISVKICAPIDKGGTNVLYLPQEKADGQAVLMSVNTM